MTARAALYPDRLPSASRLLFLTLALPALLLSRALPARPDEPPTAPVLRIESAMHSSKVNAIAVDAANRYLVTAAHDETVRVWDRHTGALLRVLRPPMLVPGGGRLYAVAITPDGATVACGGWAGQASGPDRICIFARATGRLARVITGVPNSVNGLAFSPDGRFLAAALMSKAGLRVYNTDGYTVAAEDAEYGGGAHAAAFDRDGRLATTCDDGCVRLYNPQFRRLAKAKIPGGGWPAGLAFSPDGKRLAVGNGEVRRVSVLSGRNLSPLYEPDTAGVHGIEHLDNVCWSPDGETLWAGGLYSFNNRDILLRCWPEAGRGRAKDFPVSTNSIMGLTALSDGGVAFASADPAMGIVDAEGRRTLFHGRAAVDYRSTNDDFLISRDARVIQSRFRRDRYYTLRFEVPSRSLAVEPPAAEDVTPPLTEAPGLTVTDWDNDASPKLNGKALPLNKGEVCRSYAIAPGGEAVLIGSEWGVHCFEPDGKQRWQVDLPGVAWHLNVAANGQVLAAAIGDGTIRWYRMRDGQELLAFCALSGQPSGKDLQVEGATPSPPRCDRWVMWTPSGYYDCSPGAEDLIGWQVSRGPDQAADFFPASRFRSTHYRPDVLDKVLQVLDEGEAVRWADEEAGRTHPQPSAPDRLPPVVTLLSPEDGAQVSGSSLVVRWSAQTPQGAPVTAARVMVDGRPAAIARDLEVEPAGGGQAREIRVPIPPHDCEIAVVAENRYATSTPAAARVHWRGPSTMALRPKLYVLAVGVSAYPQDLPALRFAAKDARDFAAAWRAQAGGLYREVEVKVLTDADATRDAVVDGLDWILHQTTSRDVAAVFFSGHGLNDERNTYYFAPVDFRPEAMRRTGVSARDIRDVVEGIAGKVLFFIDTCHSGNALGGRRSRGVDINGLANELSSAENGAVVFTASTGKQLALEDPAWGNGAFTHALVEGLNGKADVLGQGKITINSLDFYLSERVKALTDGRQTPTSTRPETIADFPIAVTGAGAKGNAGSRAGRSGPGFRYETPGSGPCLQQFPG